MVVVLAGCSDAHEQRIIPRSGKAKAEISFFIMKINTMITAISPHLNVAAGVGAIQHFRKVARNAKSSLTDAVIQIRLWPADTRSSPKRGAGCSSGLRQSRFSAVESGFCRVPE